MRLNAYIYLTACALSVLSAFGGCKQIAAPSAEAGYTADLLLCVDKFSTRAEINACKDSVRAKWGIKNAAK